MECYSAVKRNDSDICNTLDGPKKNYTYKKTSKCYILYDSMYITFLKWQIIEMETKLVVSGRLWLQRDCGKGREVAVDIKGSRRDPCDRLFCGLTVVVVIESTYIVKLHKTRQHTHM